MINTFSVKPLKMYRKLWNQSIRSISIFRTLGAKNLYDSLEINPHATQAEIKDAYYKLSMMYHPDRNTGIAAADKFRDITEAYEVLRNVRLRKLYDKGLYLNRSAPVVSEEEVNKFYKSRQHRSKVPPPTGRTPIYDFDEWSKSHYGATLARDIERKRRRENERVERLNDIEDVKKNRVFFCVMVLLVLGGYLFYGNEDYDVVGELITEKDINRKK